MKRKCSASLTPINKLGTGSALTLVLMKSVGPVGAEPSLLVPSLWPSGFCFLAVSGVSHFILMVMSANLRRLLQSAESEEEACRRFTLT